MAQGLIIKTDGKRVVYPSDIVSEHTFVSGYPYKAPLTKFSREVGINSGKETERERELVEEHVARKVVEAVLASQQWNALVDQYADNYANQKPLREVGSKLISKYAKYRTDDELYSDYPSGGGADEHARRAALQNFTQNTDLGYGNGLGAVDRDLAGILPKNVLREFLKAATALVDAEIVKQYPKELSGAYQGV